MIDKETVAKTLQNYLMVAVGIAILSFGWTAFMLPHQITGGGVSGIAAVLYFATGLPVGISTMAINTLLVLIAWRILGRRFCINTIICSALLSIFMGIGQQIFVKPLVPDTFMCTIIGAALAGLGGGIAINHGGNTGGADILVLMIRKYRNISYGIISLYFNVIVIISSYFTVWNVEKLVYSFVVMFAYTFFSDMVIDGYKQTYQFLVFSTKSHEIAKKINEELKRGATFLKGTGAYTNEPTEVLLIIAHRSDKVRIIRIIKEIDDTSFISVSKANSVFGKNFEKIKV
ncbi:MAG: YitT family protein [Bacteroidales bacterium]|nr:YitT family protein [Bacteroidales bacterium]